MPQSYEPQFRAMVIEQVRNGETVATVAGRREVSLATVYRWIRQGRIDRGERAGV